MTLIPGNVDAGIVALTASTAGAHEPTAGPGRTITGMIVLWDTVGNTSAGPTIFTAGSIALPDDLSRVKLLLDHDHSRPVGYMIAADELPTGIRGTFAVPESRDGDLALAQARDKLRDGLSVGAQISDYSFDGSERLVVKASDLNETSLVSVPAFRDSIVSAVTASRKDRIVSRKQLINIAASAAATGEPASTPAEPAEQQQTGSAGEQQQQTGSAGEQQQTEPAATPAAQTVANVSSASSRPSDVEAANATRSAVAGTPVPASPRRDLSLTAMVRLIADTLRRDESASRVGSVVTAALNDVTPSNISTTDYGPTMPQYVRDLFVAADVARPLVDAFGTKQMTSLKHQGHVWETRPQVQRYAGNKAPVPSNAIKRRRVDATHQRFAGGWDVDRAFIDLDAEESEIEEILIEATKDYLTQSEAWTAERVAAQATPLYGDALSVPAALAMIGVYFSRVRGSRLSVIEMGSEAWEAFANMKDSDAPWWLRSLGSLSFTTSTASAAGLTFGINPDMEPTEILGADRRAVSLWERQPPVKVRAVDVANGGVDIGVFGYMAELVSDPRLVINVDTAGRTEPVGG